MATIKINDDWQIVSDPYNWILRQRIVAEDSGKERWDTEGYYPTLAAAVKGAIDQEVKVPADLYGVLAKLDELYQLISCTFKDGVIVAEDHPEETDDFLR